MNKTIKTLIATGVAGAAGLVLAGTAVAAPVIRTGAGADPAAITPARDQYRADLGGGNTAGANGLFGNLRREINWDGVPEQISEPALFPGNTFNARGVDFVGSPGGFMVSNNAGPSRFNTLRNTYSLAFGAFSTQKLFTPIGGTTTDVDFTVPGGKVPATTNGFGAVFTDVDSATSSRLELYGVDGKRLINVPVPPSGVPNGGFSFVGVSFDAGERVARARIVTGDTAITNTPGTSPPDITQGGPGDVVVLDDFLYGEPKVRTAAALKPGKKLAGKFKLGKGATKTLSVPFSNTGETAAQNARVCLKLSKAAKAKVRTKGAACKTVGTVAPGATATAKLKVKSIAGKGTVTGSKVQLKADGVNVAKKLKITVE